MDREDFKRVWLPLSGNFYRAAYNIIGSEQQTKDILQDLYVKLWNIRDSLENIESPLAYGTRIIRNMALDKVRGASYRMRRESAVAIDEISLSDTPFQESAEQGIIGKEMVMKLKQVLGQMPEPQRSVVEMRLFKDMDYAEIARRTGLSQINVRVMVSRGRKMIARMLVEYM